MFRAEHFSYQLLRLCCIESWWAWDLAGAPRFTRSLGHGLAHDWAALGRQAIGGEDPARKRMPDFLKGGTVASLFNELFNRPTSSLGPTSQGLTPEATWKDAAVENIQAPPRLTAKRLLPTRRVVRSKISPIHVQVYAHFIRRSLCLLSNRVELGDGDYLLVIVEDECPALLAAAIQLHAIFAAQAHELDPIYANRMH